MNTNQVWPSRCSKPLPVRLDPFPVDERAIYIDSICAVLIDSRFGPGRSIQRFEVHLSEYPESVVDLDVLCDVTNNRPIPSYLASPDVHSAGKHNAVRRCMTSAIRLELDLCDLASASTRDQTLSPSTHGRGSPQKSLGRISQNREIYSPPA